ncbi:MAG TPA: hypothetical protein HA258_07265, partial [Thermoplasmata archaeon]|nr:hypothetical protein [Thermoplasmata archaeon]
MKKYHINVIFSAGVVVLFLLSSCAAGIISTTQSTIPDNSNQEDIGVTQNALVTCYVGGMPRSQSLSYESGVHLKELFTELAAANAHSPYSAKTQDLQQQILLYAEQQGLLPRGMSADVFLTQLRKQGPSFVTKSIGGGVFPLGVGREM